MNVKEYKKQHYLKNREKYTLKAKEWCKKNPQKRKIVANSWTKRNISFLLEKQKERRKTLYGKSINVFSGIKCRLKKNEAYKNIKLMIVRKDVFNLLKSFSGTCPVCGEKTSRPSIDRINPDGHYELGNLRIICLYCNQKGARVVRDKKTGRFISAR
jgi:hypothetical protein